MFLLFFPIFISFDITSIFEKSQIYAFGLYVSQVDHIDFHASIAKYLLNWRIESALTGSSLGNMRVIERESQHIYKMLYTRISTPPWSDWEHHSLELRKRYGHFREINLSWIFYVHSLWCSRKRWVMNGKKDNFYLETSSLFFSRRLSLKTDTFHLLRNYIWIKSYLKKAYKFYRRIR